MIRRLAVFLALAAALIIACISTWMFTWRQGVEALRDSASTRVERVAANLQSTLDRYAFLPYLVSNHPYIQEALEHPASPGNIDRANRFLSSVTSEAHANATYVINTQSQAIASSNWDQAVSFIGQRYEFRPYFTDAIKGGVGRFFGIGTSNAEPGYFVSQPVHGADGKILGVTVVKLDLEWFPRTDSSAPLIVTDDHGVIFLSSEPAWKYHTLRPLTPEVEAAVYRSRQYAQQRLQPLDLKIDEDLERDARIVRVGAGRQAVRYLATTHRMTEPHWQLITLTSLDPVVSSANYATAITAFSGVCLFLIGFYLRMRRARIRDMIRSGALLRTAYAELNQRVEERTADLSAANARLQTEVSERTRAEQELRAAHRELMQASKLAALGQMAAGITHELNQPLAALRTFSDNTRILLARGNVDAAGENLDAIASLTERMGRITNQLKLFVGKARPRDVSAPVPRAIANAVTLLGARLDAVALHVWYDPVLRPDERTEDTDAATAARDIGTDAGLDAGLDIRQDRRWLAVDPKTMSDTPSVWCDQLRLEQLLINVLGNAADALRGRAQPRIDIFIRASSTTVTITTIDNGPGIPEDALAHLFEPFFTTKESGEGLGLGLAISGAIASEYGGSLRAENRFSSGSESGFASGFASGFGPVAEGQRGAAFILTLRRADEAVRQSLMTE